MYNPDDYQACVAFTEKDFQSGRAKVGALDKHGQKITDWSECSKSCGGGVQFRYKGVAIKRDAIGTPCNAWCPEGSDRNDCLYERRACNVKACVTKKQVDEKKYLAVEGKVKKLEASLQTYQKRDSLQAKAIASTKSDMADLRKQLQTQERLKKQLSDSTAKVTQLQTKLKSSQQAEKAATKQITSTKSDMASLQQQLKRQEALQTKLDAEKSKNKQLLADKAANAKRIKTIKAELKADKATLAKATEAKAAADRQIASTKKAMAALQKKLQAQEALKKQRSDNTAKLKKQLAQVQQQLATNQGKLKSDSAALAAATKAKADAEKTIAASTSDMVSLRQQLKKQEALKKQLDAEKSKNKQLVAEKTATAKTIQTIQAKLKADKAKLAKAAKEKAAADQQIASIKSAMAALQKKLKAQESLQKTLDTQKSQNQSLQKAKAANEATIQKIKAELAKDKTNLGKLEKAKAASDQTIKQINSKLQTSEQQASNLRKTITCEVDNMYNCAYRTCKFTKVASAKVCENLQASTKGNQMRYHKDTQNCFVDGYSSWASKTQKDGDDICLVGRPDKRFASSSNLFTRLPENQHPATCKGTTTRICKPRDCSYVSEGNFTSCSRSCDGGIQTRNRTIDKNPQDGGRTCKEPPEPEEQACNTQLCCPLGPTGKVCNGKGTCDRKVVTCNLRGIDEKACQQLTTSRLKGTISYYSYGEKDVSKMLCKVAMAEKDPAKAEQSCRSLVETNKEVLQAQPTGTCTCLKNWNGVACQKEYVSCLYQRKASDYKKTSTRDFNTCKNKACVDTKTNKYSEDPTFHFCADLGTTNLFGGDIGVEDCQNRGGTLSDKPCVGSASSGGLNFDGTYGNYQAINANKFFTWDASNLSCGQRCLDLRKNKSKPCNSECKPGQLCDPTMDKQKTSAPAQPGMVGWDLVTHYNPSFLQGQGGQAKWQNIRVCAKKVSGRVYVGSIDPKTQTCNLSYAGADAMMESLPLTCFRK